MADLSEKAMRVAEAGPPPTPAGFAIASTGKGSTAELRDRIELTSHALQAAEARLNGAARREDEHAAVLIAIALTETLMWVRTLDDVMNDAWQRDLPSSVREAASQRVDEYVARRPHLADAMRPVREQRRRTGEPYSDWTQLLIGKGLFVPRAKLKGLRWVAGKLLHFGPLPAIELRHWRAGAAPRWKWRDADEIFPPALPERHEAQRMDYQRHLAGRDVLGSLNLTIMLIELEHLVLALLREAAQDP
jgi:hypothetical protein